MTVPLYSLSDTWNNAGTAFDAIKMNVTDTGHSSSSTLLNLQIGASQKFAVDPGGQIIIGGDTYINRQGSGMVGIGLSSGGTGGTLQAAFGVFNFGSLSANTQVLAVSGTWNNAAVTFDAPIFVSITDTNSASGSLLIDLQVGGATKFSVKKDGTVFPAYPAGANPTATASDTAVNGSAATFMRSDGAPAIQKTSASVFGLCKVDGTSITASSGVISGAAASPGTPSGAIQYNNSGSFGGFGTWDGSAVMALVNSTTAQELDIYGSFTSSSTYSRFQAKTAVSVTDHGGNLTATVLRTTALSSGVGANPDSIFLQNDYDSRCGFGARIGFNWNDAQWNFRRLNSSNADAGSWVSIQVDGVSCNGITYNGLNNFPLFPALAGSHFEVTLQESQQNGLPGVVLARDTANGNTGGLWWIPGQNSNTSGADTGLVRSAANVVEINNGTNGTGPGVLLLRGAAFGSLPASPVAGMIAYVTDSTVATWGSTIAGSSTHKVLAWYNGTNWTVAGS